MSGVSDLLREPDTTVAVVGATDDPAKYGSVIYRDLKAKGFEVFAVNPHRSSVDGDPAYPSLEALPEAPTIVDFVVPPEVTRTVLEEALRLGYTTVWIQPGAGNRAVDDYLAANGFHYLSNACVMVHSQPRSAV